MIQVSFIPVMLISIILWIIYRGIEYKKNKYINLFREVTLLLFLIYFLVLLNLTIFKYSSIEFMNQFESYMYQQDGILGIVNIIPFKETIATLTDGHIPIMHPIKNIFGNILAFMPLGFLIPLLYDKYNNIKRIFLLGLFSSISIEVVQLFVGGNISDIDDIIFNTSGAILGFLCFKMFEKKYSNIKIKNLLDKIKDYNTENIFKKSMKVILSIAIISIAVYNYAIYNQTASAKLQDEELIKAVFKEDIGKIHHIENIGDDKLYLVENETGLTVEKIQKYSEDRYMRSYQGYQYFYGENDGYAIDISSDYNNETDKTKVNLMLYGKNSNADKVVISLGEKEYKAKLDKDEYFLKLYSEYVDFSEEEISNLYGENNGDILDIKFLDENNNEIKDMNLIQQ